MRFACATNEEDGCVSLTLLSQILKTTPVGFEPTRGDPIGLAGRRLNRSAKVSSALLVDLLSERIRNV